MKARPFFLAAAALLLAASVTAQPIEEIVVTGELRESSLADSPASISVLSLNGQRSGTVNHLEELLGRIPNVNFSSGGARARFVQIRGIGESGQFAEPLNPSVGLVLDGVDLTGLGLAATLFDVDQVEVLRGPQGTLYGANALAGLINIRSNDPTPAFQSKLRLEGGDYGTLGVGGVVSGPVTDTLGYRLAAQQYQDDGFIHNRYLHRHDTNAHDELTVRGKLRWQPREDQTWTFTAGLANVNDGYDAFSLDNDRTTLSDQPGQDDQKTTYGSAVVHWDVSDAVSFVGTLGGSHSDSDYGYDEDWTYVGFDPEGYSSTDRYLRKRDGASVDLRLVSGPSGRLFGDSTDWVVGVYALEQSVDLTRRYTFFPSDFTSSDDVERFALYGELEHDLTPSTRLTFGLRVERHSADYQNSDQVRFSPVDHLYGGRLVLEHDLARNAMVYLSATRGYKVGGFNISGTLDPDLRQYDPEALWNYETGVKGSWLDDRLSVRAAVFTMQRKDVQVDTSISRERSDGSVEFIDLVSNAAEGTNNGLELEVDYRPVGSVTLFANVGLLDTDFKNFINNNGENLDGEAQAQAPGYQFFAGAEFRPRPGWYVRLEAEGKDAYFFSNSNRFVPDSSDVRSNPYELYNVSLGYQARRWSVKLWGRNLSDRDYPVRGYYFGNDPRTGYEPNGWFQLGEPRRFGVTLTVNN